MKKLLSLFILTSGIKAATAQVVIPMNTNDQSQKIIKAGKALENLKQPMIMESRHTTSYPDKAISVEAAMSKDAEKGYVLNFKSSFPIHEVNIKGTEPASIGGTTSYGDGVMSGIFYLDAPVYKGSGTYVITFYAKGLTLPVWQVLVQRKIPAVAN